MDIPFNAEVQCTDGSGGNIERIIVDPVTRKITHIVVRESGMLGEAVMTPVEFITESTPTTVRIRLSIKELKDLQIFVEKNYLTTSPESIPMAQLGYGVYPIGGVAYWPFYPVSESDYIIIDSSLPKGELALHRREAEQVRVMYNSLIFL